jgi:hypothetical protein
MLTDLESIYKDFGESEVVDIMAAKQILSPWLRF